MKAKHYQNMQVQIKNKISIEAQSLEMDAANMTCNTIDMKLDKLTIQTRQDELKQSSQHFNASTTGAVGMHQSQTQSRQVNQTAGIHVTSGIAKEDMQVKEANLIGAAITSDGYNGFEPDQLNTTTLKDYSKTRGFGISGNLNSISNALKSESESSSRLTTFNLSHEKRDYAAENRATIFGKAGVNENLQLKNPNLNTSSANSKRVTCDKAQNIALDVPIEIIKSSVKTSIQFFKPIEPKEKPNLIIPTPPEEEGPQNSSNPIENILLEADNENQPVEIAKNTKDAEDNSPCSPIETITSPKEIEPIIEEDEENQRQAGPFDPDLQTQKLGLKQGRHRQQLCNKDNQRYTTLEKEIDISIENNKVTTGIECVLIEEGDKGDGFYYTAKIDPLSSQLIIDTGLGKQACFNLDTQGLDLGSFGSSSYAIDACSAQALINAQLELNSTQAAGSVNGSLGLMGPSAAASYTTPCLSFMGLSFQMHLEGAVGVGAKADIGLGAQADATKMKTGFCAKLGFFAGLGLSGKLRVDVGVDGQYGEKYANGYQQAMEAHPVARTIIEKIEQGKEEGRWVHLEEWERDELDMAMDSVPFIFWH